MKRFATALAALALSIGIVGIAASPAQAGTCVKPPSVPTPPC